MRPTNTSVQQFEQAQAAYVPQVGRQVVATPVQFAVDDSAFKKLDILQNQLNTFTSGQMASAKLDDRLQQQRDQMQAEVDFARDPGKFDAHSGSGYYYLHGVDLMGEAEAVKMSTRAQEAFNALAQDPERLRSTNVQQFFDDHLAGEMQGVSDPIVAKHLNKEAHKLRTSMLPALAKAQIEAETQYRRDTSHYIFSERADTPENTASYLQSDFQNMVARLGKDAAVEVVSGVLSNKIAEAQTADEAAAWLDAFKTQIPGSRGPDGKGLTFAQVGGERLAGGVSKLTQSVQSMRDAESRATEAARKDAEREAAKALREQQEMNFADAKALLDTTHDERSLADAVNLLGSMELSSAQKQSLGIQVRSSLGKMALREASDMENPDALTKKFAETVKSGDWGQGIQVATATIARLRAGSDPSAVRGYVKGLFEDMSLMQVETGADGSAKLSAQNQALLGVYSAISADPDLVSLIPEKDQRFARTLTNKMQENSGNLALALKETKAAMSKPMKAIAREAAGAVVENFLDKTVSQKLFGDYSDVSQESQLAVRRWADEKLANMSEHDYPTPEDQKRALDTFFHNEFIVMSNGFGPGRTTDAVFVGPRAAEGYAIKDAQGNTVQRQFNQTDMQAAWKQTRGYLESKGYKNVSLQPTDNYTGEHMITATVNGNLMKMPVHVTQINEWAYRLAEEKAAGLDLEPVMNKPVVGAGPAPLLLAAGSKLASMFGDSAQASSNGAISRFVEQLQLGVAREDVRTSVQAIPNAVSGARKEQAQSALYNLQARELKARLKQ